MFPKTSRLLVVDDMPKMRDLVTRQLKSLGYVNVLVASNGKEALGILNDHFNAETPIDLVFSDWNMPILAGIDLLIAVRQSENFKDVPFIMVTAEGQRDQVMLAIKVGVSNYIVKPFPPVQLELKIQAVWDKLTARKNIKSVNLQSQVAYQIKFKSPIRATRQIKVKSWIKIRALDLRRGLWVLFVRGARCDSIQT